MKIVTRTTAINNLKKHIGKDLRKLALQYGITTYETGKQNKGWKGLVLERLAGLENNVSKAPNGLSYELKSVSFHEVKNLIINDGKSGYFLHFVPKIIYNLTKHNYGI